MPSAVHRLAPVIIALNLIAAPTVASGQVLHDFATADGGPPVGELTAGRDGDLYGATATGGVGGHGTLFRVDPTSPGFQVVYSFTGLDPDGAEPSGAALVEGADGVFYGTTRSGGEFGSGTLFRFTAPSTVETIFSFPADKADPRGGVIIGSDGRLYGTTGGGAAGFGLVYGINIDGTGFQALKEFAGGADGGTPVAGVIEGSDLFLYGTTLHGSTLQAGTVFRMSKDGASFQTLAEIDGPLGFGVTEFFDENANILYMYGVTGEPRDLGSLDPFALSDFIFRVRADGTPIGGNPYQQLYSFAPFAYDVGFSPSGRLLLGSDGKLYGTTLAHSYPSSGCVNFGCGAVYRFNPAGGIPFAIHVFKEFDGSRPAGGVTEGLDGRLFGLTSEGGSNGLGVLYAIANAGAIPIRVTGPASIQTGAPASYTLQIVSPAGSSQDLFNGNDLVVQPSVGLTLSSESTGTPWSCLPYGPVPGAYLCTYNGIVPAGTASQVHTMTFNVSGPPLLIDCGPVASPCVSLRADMPATSATTTAFTNVVVTNPNTGQPNQAPQAADDTADFFNTSPVTIAVLDNDADPDGDSLQVDRIIASPAYGNAVVNPDGTITYTPSVTTLPAADHFSYRVVDPYGASDVANVTVTQLTGFSVHKSLIDLGVIRAGTMAAGRSMISGPPNISGHFEFEAVPPAEVATLLAGTGHSPAQAIFDPAAFSADGWATDEFASPIYYLPLVPGRVSIARVHFVPEGTSVSLGSLVIVGEAADAATGPLYAVEDSAGTPLNTPVVIDLLGNDRPVTPGKPLYLSSLWACTNTIQVRFPGVGCDLVRGTVSYSFPIVNQVLFNPAAGFTGTTTFYYSSSDEEDCLNQPVCFNEKNLYFAKVTVNVGVAPQYSVTPTGQNVAVPLASTNGAATGISVTFSEVTAPGMTYADVMSNPPPLPANFQLAGAVYDITTTATMTPPITVCFSGNFGLSDHVLHYQNGGWVQLSPEQRFPSDGPPFTQICAVTQSLSPFAVATQTQTNVPPTVDAGPNQTVEATGPSGASVTVSGTASDLDGDPITFAWSGPCGTATSATAILTCPLGVNVLTLEASDGINPPVTATTTVTVRDTTPPVLSLPADISLTTSDPGGLAVTYTATAVDSVDTNVPAVCSPPSGATFTIGTTVVNCTATDDSGNIAGGAFNVTINLLQPQLLTVALSGNGSGTVTSTPPGINCPGTCSASFAMGASVTLSAVAAAGSTFVGWDGACAGTGSCTLTIGGATNVTARFLLARPVVSLKVNGQHPNPPIVTTGGPMLLTLDVSESAYTAPVSWYWALVVNGVTLWVTPTGLKTTPAPLTVSPPAAIANATLLDVTLPAHTTVTSLLLLVEGANTLIGGDLIVTARP